VIHSHATRFFSCIDSSTLQSSRYGWQHILSPKSATSSYEMHDSIPPSLPFTRAPQINKNRLLPQATETRRPRSISMAAFTWARRRSVDAHLALFPFLIFISHRLWHISKTREFITTNPHIHILCSQP
jgi:hypothetical protein